MDCCSVMPLSLVSPCSDQRRDHQADTERPESHQPDSAPAPDRGDTGKDSHSGRKQRKAVAGRDREVRVGGDVDQQHEDRSGDQQMVDQGAARPTCDTLPSIGNQAAAARAVRINRFSTATSRKIPGFCSSAGR